MLGEAPPAEYNEGGGILLIPGPPSPAFDLVFFDVFGLWTFANKSSELAAYAISTYFEGSK